jgi:hypothetical protein
MDLVEGVMSVAEVYQPKRLTVKVEKSAIHPLISQDRIFAFHTPPLPFARWTITDIPVDLPADPVAVFAQVIFPDNADLSVSDNFSTIVTIFTSSLIRVNSWRVDGSDDPSINYAYSILITV